MGRVLYLEAGTGYGGSMVSLLTVLRGGLASLHRCTIGFYSETALSSDYRSVGANVMYVHSGIASGRLGQLTRRTYRLGLWRQRTFSAGSASRLLEVLFQSPEIAVRVLPLAHAVTRITGTCGAELIHLNNSPHFNLDGLLAAAWVRIPCVCHLRSMLPLSTLEAGLATRFVKRFIAVSHAVRNHCVAQGLPADRITVIHNPRQPLAADDAQRAQVRASLGVEDGHTVFVFAGRIMGKKGIGTLLEGAARLAAVREDFRVWIVGGGGELDSWRLEAERLGIQRWVTFLGLRSDVGPMLAAADVAVVPSICDDSFPSAVLEAMAAGRPVIASRIGGIPEAVDDGITGLLVEPGIATELAQRMALLMDSLDLRLRMGRSARQRLETEFNPAQCARAIDRIYRDAWGER